MAVAEQLRGINFRRAQKLELVPPYLFGQIAEAKRNYLAKGGDIIDFGIGDPDQPTPPFIIEALANAAANPITHTYDESKWGWPSFLEAVQVWAKRTFNLELDADGEICGLIGSKEGLAHLCWAVLDPGDLVLIPEPGYPVYKMNTLFAGGEYFTMPLRPEHRFQPDLSSIPPDVSRRAKMMFLNYPNNPTGARASRQFLKEAVEFCREHNILLAHDAAYAEVVFGGQKPFSALQIPGAKDVCIEFHSLSKMFNMTGWRVGFAIGHRGAVDALRAMKANIDSKQFPALQMAAAEALKSDRSTMTASYALYEKRRRILVKGLQSLGCPIEDSQSTFYVWIPIPAGTTSAEFVKNTLEKTGVLCVPGSGYGEAGEGFARFSVTVAGDKNGERIDLAVQRMHDAGIRW